MNGQLIILRHGESEWNAKGIWTGTRDVHLTPKGRHDAELLGQKLQGTSIDEVFISQQVRTLETLEGVAKGMGIPLPSYHATGALNERDYGVYTGKNKWQIKETLGEAEFQRIRRGWDVAIPEGESLKQVYERSVPFYLSTILPLLHRDKTVLIVAHGNSIRSLMKYIESIDNEGVGDLEMIFGTILYYHVDDKGHSLSKTVKTIDALLPPA
jgi:2,3-bisphosphoglycerate-dependent phosphoglycerate mutase